LVAAASVAEHPVVCHFSGGAGGELAEARCSMHDIMSTLGSCHREGSGRIRELEREGNVTAKGNRYSAAAIQSMLKSG
jgi:hypothetical protein